MYLQGEAIDRDQQRRILEAALEEAAAAGRGGVVVFDLDSTLLDNRTRQARILREFGAARGLPALQAARPEHFTSWNLGDAMRAAGLDPAEVERHLREGREFWRARFFTSEYCEGDRPVGGAVGFVRAVVERGAQVAYVTGRHTAMEAGTVACFAREGFPLPDGAGVHLLHKPEDELGDDEWKLQALGRLDRLGQVVAAFDNEPAHINGYAARYPGALCVRLATDDSGRAIPLAPGIARIASFES